MTKRFSFKKYTAKYALLAFSSMAILSSCQNASEIITPETAATEVIIPAPEETVTDNSAIVTEEQQTIMFSGRKWRVRDDKQFTGPGLNVFSNRRGNVWVDAQGNLHLKVTKRDGKWWSAEVISEETFGYGEYNFQLATKADQLDRNIVLGMFTWNNNSFQTDGNSEIDIEFAKWGYEDHKSLQYAVQPTNWGTHDERDVKPSDFLLTGNNSTHGFSWTPSQVSFKSYYGFDNGALAGNWNFASTMPARTKIEGGRTSNPVVIPNPGTQTHVHLNLWLHDANNDGFGDAPSNGQEAEVIIKKFEYKAL